MAPLDEPNFEQPLRRLEELIGQLDAEPDATASRSARELISLVLNLHAIGLAKLTAILSTSQGGEACIARLVEDDHVRAMLLLHGLHPDDLETRVRRAVERLRPHLGVHGIRVELLGTAKGIVQLRLHQGNGGAVKASTLLTLPGEIEDAIVEAAPDVERIVIEGLDLKGDVAAVSEISGSLTAD
jgi:Fe-S cluster biogenesis protein NfuA